MVATLAESAIAQGVLAVLCLFAARFFWCRRLGGTAAFFALLSSYIVRGTYTTWERAHHHAGSSLWSTRGGVILGHTIGLIVALCITLYEVHRLGLLRNIQEQKRRERENKAVDDIVRNLQHSGHGIVDEGG
jgi:ABC-type nitrate/sulfonate/bicarbonate transport system permease component